MIYIMTITTAVIIPHGLKFIAKINNIKNGFDLMSMI